MADSDMKKKPYACTKCSRRFVLKKSLTLHSRTHYPNKAPTCNECGKIFTTAWTLKTHMITHNKSSKFKCTICDYYTTGPTCLATHMRSIHTKEKPYSCPSCPQVFPSQKYLSSHQKVHNVAIISKMFQCVLCDYKTRLKDSLLRHMCQHTNNRPYKCSKCERSFAQKHKLTCHLLDHEKHETTFKCDDCGVAYMNLAHLLRHERITHKKYKIE